MTIRAALRATTLLCVLVLCAFASAASPQAARAQDKLPLALRELFNQQGVADYLVFFDDSADLSAAFTIAERDARRQFVYDTLRAQAERTQAQAAALLQRNGVRFRPHYLLNMMQVRSDAALAQQLAAMPNVRALTPNAAARANLPQPSSRVAPAQAASIAWGVSRVRAPDVWSAYNVRGEGIVVGTADTGVQWDHPALKAHYRGWNGTSADHNYNWHDAVHDGPVILCSNDSPAPCDGLSFSHGTHVTGTMVGDDGAGNQIGVAPAARWIGCRNMDDLGNGTVARYIECFEFLFAPYPLGGNPLSDGRPELGAHIINNSWTCTSGEGCGAGNLDALRSEVQKLSAAGILVVAAAGNYGSACSTIYEPPAIYPETFTVGATDSFDAIAGFSSRGPVTADGSNRRKPDVAAPGVSVYSSVRGGGYSTSNGTSMASPHAAGVAALLWSAAPSLRGNITQTIALIQNSADARTTMQGCGGDTNSSVPNNVFGYGIVNALGALQNAALSYPLRTPRNYLPVFLKP